MKPDLILYAIIVLTLIFVTLTILDTVMQPIEPICEKEGHPIPYQLCEVAIQMTKPNSRKGADMRPGLLCSRAWGDCRSSVSPCGASPATTMQHATKDLGWNKPPQATASAGDSHK